MHLRELKQSDAPLMLEWMHDKSVVSDLKANFGAKKLADCENFIAAVPGDPHNIHLAAADDQDTYMGTVSLKHIQDGYAEFAIVVRKAAMGTGIARDAMKEILRYGIEEKKLRAIYWCVSRHNTRAVRFYDKNGYQRVQDAPKSLTDLYTQEGGSLLWYCYR